MIYALIIIPVLSILVFVHELGHFVMAKRAKMGVEEFGFGFPPRLWGKKVGETTYSINWIPFGGFVKIQGEDGDDRMDSKSFGTKGFFARISVVTAGVIMNFLFAVFLLAIVNMTGTHAVTIAAVAPRSPAEAAGLRANDIVEGYKTTIEVQDFVNAHRGQSITLWVNRDGLRLQFSAIPRVHPPAGEGALGIQFRPMALPPGKAIVSATTGAARGVPQIISGFGTIITNLVRTGHIGADLAGPLGIAVMSGEAAREGLPVLLSFVAFLSLNLAVINIMPFPALDGGRLLFLIIEKFTGRPLPKRFENAANAVGFALLLLLMLLITTKDIFKYL